LISIFIEHLEQHLELTLEDKDMLYRTLSVKGYKKGNFILQEGQVSKAFFFNLKGLVRLFYNKGTSEVSAFFYPEGHFISAYESFIDQQPSTLSLQTIEASKIIRVSREAARALLAHSPKFGQLARWAMENELISYQKMVANLLRWSPEQRYRQLLEQNPELFARVPQQYIASFIGVSPETLSRIKKRWHAKRT